MGVIAIGQFATGVIAIGQVATGVIAIGQVARGGIAVGMGAVGLFAYGMAAVGLFSCGAMMGIGGSKAFGLVIPLVPSLGRYRDVPETMTLEQLYAKKRWAGWIELTVRPTKSGAAFEHAGKPLPLRVEGISRDKVSRYARGHPRRTYAYVNVAGSALTCTRLMDSGTSMYARVSFAVKTAAQIAALFAITIALWIFVITPIREVLYGPGGVFAR